MASVQARGIILELRGLAGQRQYPQSPQPLAWPQPPLRYRRRCSCTRMQPAAASAAPAGGGSAGGSGPAPIPGEHSEAERAKVMADGERRAAAAAARHRQDPAVMEVVDGIVESFPPSQSMYVLRLLLHAVDPPEVARENKDAITDDFFLAVRSVLTSPQFKQATTGGAPRASCVVSVFDNAWRAAMAVKSQPGAS